MEADRKIDYRSQSDELMQLIVQGVESDIERNDQVVSTAVTGWDEQCGNATRSPKLHYPNIPETNPLYTGSNSWYNGAFLDQTGEKTIVNGYESRAGIKDQSPKSNMHHTCLLTPSKQMKRKNMIFLLFILQKSSRYSCCWKLLPCFYRSRYEKCSKSFKNGGL
ncbi:hypothetical protein DKX38_023854 [Salix brachista]|uniref:Uncharacterized protein n=1 Tax=Salix brachista TaxID=2182728 RepID=A0A5N5JR28_9ROSI|nr:hypothetical protein DKX38_023854 [Salix brachista]